MFFPFMAFQIASTQILRSTPVKVANCGLDKWICWRQIGFAPPLPTSGFRLFNSEMNLNKSPSEDMHKRATRMYRS